MMDGLVQRDKSGKQQWEYDVKLMTKRYRDPMMSYRVLNDRSGVAVIEPRSEAPGGTVRKIHEPR